MINNFTSSINYRNSHYYRFFSNKIITLNNLDLIKYYDGLNCFQYFDFELDASDIQKLTRINKRNEIKFRNINLESNVFKTLYKKFEILITDEWEAPIIEIKKGCFDEYLHNKNSDFRRMIKKCNQYKKSLKIVTSNKNNIHSLLKDALLVDQNSWKHKEKSDMLNLYNEHIIYLSLLNYCKLCVAYINNCPVGYSLLVYYNGIYYSAKWGATDDGRKLNAGINCLLFQIKKIVSKEDLLLDLWGRKNKIYDRMATKTIKRVYFKIVKNGIKNS